MRSPGLSRWYSDRSSRPTPKRLYPLLLPDVLHIVLLCFSHDEANYCGSIWSDDIPTRPCTTRSTCDLRSAIYNTGGFEVDGLFQAVLGLTIHPRIHVHVRTCDLGSIFCNTGVFEVYVFQRRQPRGRTQFRRNLICLC